jgi:signal transduction histidine kinase
MRDGRRELQAASLDVTPLREALRAREDVLSVVSHDLRSPLGAVTLAAASIERTLLPDEAAVPLRRSTEVILRSAQRMARLIDDLLDWGSIQAGRLAVERRPENPGQLIAEAMATFDLAARDRSLRLTMDVAPGLPAVLGDRGRLVQVLSNLIANAIKATAAGGSVDVRAREVRAGGAVQFDVADTGSGISREDLGRIFERYWRGFGGEHRGTGLGLAIATGLVEAHEGRIWAESAVGVGSTFSFTVPAIERRDDSRRLREVTVDAR